MPSAAAIGRIKKKVPTGKTLPEGFDAFLSAGLPVSIRWSPLKDYGFGKTAERELIPFVHIADGSLVALWYSVDPAAVVYVGAHGEPPRVVAKDVPNFLRSVSASRTGIPEIDDDCCEVVIEDYDSRVIKSGLAALQKKLNEWVEATSSLQNPNDSPDDEQVRKRILAIAKRMIRDGKSKVYKTHSDWWSMNYRVQRRLDGLGVQYLDFGEWHDVPQEYKLDVEVGRLLSIAKSRKRRKYEVTVTKDGIVSVDDDRELVLVPPD